MKQKALAIAAATMLTVGLGIANASEQSGLPDQSAGADMSACNSGVCPSEELTNQESDTNGGILVGQQNESMNDTAVEEQAEDQHQAEDQDTGTAEQASDESRIPDVIIFVQ